MLAKVQFTVKHSVIKLWERFIQLCVLYIPAQLQ